MNPHHSTRRQLLEDGTWLAAAVAIAVPAELSADAPCSEYTLHDQIDLPAKAARVYDTFLDQKLFRAFTGEAAEIDPQAGGSFTLFAGRVKGRTVELTPGARIVQAWRVETWPESVYAMARFEFRANDPGSRILFDLSGFPPSERQAQLTGWPRFYWTPLRKYLAS